MTQPLALVLYEKVMPGTQLVNRLQDLGYRVLVVEDPSKLIATAESSGPLLVFADLESTRVNILELISQLRRTATTSHVPAVVFYSGEKEGIQEQATASGVTVLASESAMANHLPQLLEQALRVD